MVWHAARMVLSRPGQRGTVAAHSAPVAVGERSAWMVAGMVGCLFVSVALGVHLPEQLGSLLTSAVHRLAVPA